MLVRILQLRDVLDNEVFAKGHLNHVQKLTDKEWAQVAEIVEVLQIMHNLSQVSQEEELTCVKFMK